MRSLTSRWMMCVAALVPLLTFAAPPALQNSPDAARLYDLAAREAQYQRLSGIADAVVEYGQFGRVRQLDGHTGIFLANPGRLKQGDSAAFLLEKLKPILLAGGSESLVVREVVPAPKRGHYVLTDQWIEGLPVIGSRVNFIVDPNGEVLMMNSLFVARGKATRTPKLSLQAAKAKLEQSLLDTDVAEAGSLTLAAEGSLAFWTDEGQAATPRLLWLIDANFTQRGEPQTVRFGIDAATGELRHSEQLRFGLNRTVYSKGYRSGTDSLPGSLTYLWGEGSNPNPAEPHAAYVYDKIRSPIQAWANTPLAYDTLGLAVHYGLPGSDQAKNSYFQYGTDNKPYLVFSDSRAMDDDAIAHEYGHGLFVRRVPGEPSSLLRFWDEWFAANEFFGDLSAVATDISRRGGNVDLTQTWAITDLRDWRDPEMKGKGNTFKNRDWYLDWRYAGAFDVPYSNSTIFGHAVYLMINGGYHRRSGERVWGNVIPSLYVPPAPPAQIQQVLAYGAWRLAVFNRKFSALAFRDETVTAALAMYGPGVADTVDKGWQAVGIRHACTAPPPVPLPNSQSALCAGRYNITWPVTSGVKYHGEIVRLGYPYDLATTSLDVTHSDAGTGSCTTSVSVDSRFHMRACNGCGCSEWSTDKILRFYPQCL